MTGKEIATALYKESRDLGLFDWVEDENRITTDLGKYIDTKMPLGARAMIERKVSGLK